MKAVKYYLIPLFALLLAFEAQGQMFFDMGVKYAYGPTLLLNKNIFDDRDYDHTITSGSAIGAKIGANFADFHAFTFDFMSATSNQNFEFQQQGQNTGRNEYEWKHNDFMILYRYSGHGAYIEIGPKLSNVKSVNQSLNGAPNVDVSTNFEDQYTSVVFGFGSYLMGGDAWTIQVGVRAHYAFGDFISAEGQESNFPTNFPDNVSYDEYRETKAAAVQFGMEFNYVFGRFGKAKCSDRWKLFLFQ